MTERQILNAIATCTRMENLWYNGRTPNSTFRPGVEQMRRVLEELLEIKAEYKKAA